MEELRAQIKEIEENIRQYRTLLLLSQNNLAAQCLPILVEGLEKVIPQIVVSYEREEFKEVRADQQYWVNQLQRVLDAIESGDSFLQIDVLYYEILENLELYLDMTGGLA